MAYTPAVPDETTAEGPGGHAGLVHRVSTDLRRWFGLDDDPLRSVPIALRVLGAVRDRAFGQTTLASPSGPTYP